MQVQKVPQNFKYPDIKPDHYRYGSNQLLGVELRPNGDWRDYLPPEEDQKVNGVESSACYIEASQHSIATIEEEELGEPDNNYSARFNALLSGGSKDGGDPLRGADSIRNDGLVAQKDMPWDGITSWDEFHSWKGVSEFLVRQIGQTYRRTKKLGNDIVFERNEPVLNKYAKLRGALKYSPCPISVTAWYQRANGEYYKPDGAQDNHLVEAVYVDPTNHIYIRDTYSPYLKKLEANYNPDFGMRWSVERRSVDEQLSALRAILEAISGWLKTRLQKLGIMSI